MSSFDESSEDEDYKPQSEDSDIPSEGETDYDSEGNKIDKVTIAQNNKRKKKQIKKLNKKRNVEDNSLACPQDNTLQDKKQNEEEEKRRAEALWTDFLNDTSSTSSFQKEDKEKENCKQSIAEGSSSGETESSSKKTLSSILPKELKETKSEEEIVVTRVFEFANEEIKVDEKVTSNEIKSKQASTSSTLSSQGLLKKIVVPTPRSGLSSVLSNLGKKSKLSVLEKSKFDWNNYKKQEGIEEDLQTFNKGKDG